MSRPGRCSHQVAICHRIINPNVGVFASRLILAVSITGFDYKAMADKTAFLKVSMAHHRAAEKIMLANIPDNV